MKRINLSHSRNSVDFIVESKSKHDKKPSEIYSSLFVINGWKRVILKPEYCKGDCERCYVDSDICDSIEYHRINWFWEYIKNLYIYRFFEIWGFAPRNCKDFTRGLGIDDEKSPISESIAGIFGFLNSRGFIKKTGIKNGQILWEIKIKPNSNDYKYIKSLNVNAINNCQQIAKENSGRNRTRTCDHIGVSDVL